MTDFVVTASPDDFTIVEAIDDMVLTVSQEDYTVTTDTDNWDVTSQQENQITVEMVAVGVNDAAIAVAAAAAAAASANAASTSESNAAASASASAMSAGDAIAAAAAAAVSEANAFNSAQSAETSATDAQSAQGAAEAAATSASADAGTATAAAATAVTAEGNASAAQTAAEAAQVAAEAAAALATSVIPTGGTTGQVLAKASNTDYDYSWVTVSGLGDMTKAIYDPTNVLGDAFDRGNHHGTQLAATISDFSTAADARVSAAIGVTVQAYSAVLAATTASFTTAMDAKLAGIATGATANQTNAYLLSRANHTGTQLAATISDFAGGMTTNYSAAINGLVAATVLADADVSVFRRDSGGLALKITWANIKAFLKTYFDTAYVALASYTAADVLTKIKTVDGTGSGLDADLLQGAAPSAAATASTVALRNGSGDITARLFRSEYASTTSGAAYFVGQHAVGTGAADNYLRPMTIAQAKSILGVGTMADRSLTISTAAPSGGADGDVWLQVA